jgi:hypothetical protein
VREEQGHAGPIAAEEITMPDRRGQLYAQDGADVPDSPRPNFGRFLAVVGWILIGLAIAFFRFGVWVNGGRVPQGFLSDRTVELTFGTPIFVGIAMVVIGHRMSWRFRQRKKRS